MIEIDQLKLTQDGLRNPAALAKMASFSKCGGQFTEDVIQWYANSKRAPLIGITEFEDGDYFVHDGHHRVASIWMSGRNFLYYDEFFIKQMTYDHYNQLGFDKGWVTPFDPRTHVRVPDFGKFKSKALELYANNPEEAKDFVLSNRSSYTVPRTPKHDHISGIVGSRRILPVEFCT